MNANQSVLAPHGIDAGAIATLSWIMFAGAALIFFGVLAFALIAYRGTPGLRQKLAGDRFILIWGAIFPTATLTALLVYGLTLTGARVMPAAANALKIEISGEQWWWRVRYAATEHSAEFMTANEIRIPVGRQVEIKLSSVDVIHSFWLPNLAGKVDMIPGIDNRIRLTATKTGIFRGQCAEYCGGAHALMAFNAVALEPVEFSRWLAGQAQSAVPPKSPPERLGSETFLLAGCGACHTIRGTAAQGTIGPDLTHVGGRLALASGILPNDAQSFSEWISNNQHIKPNNRMPPFRIFSTGELDALGAYLDSLR
jgi:cytochrome c oxidase subunit 2